MAPPIQDIWHSNNYINVVNWMDIVVIKFYEVSKMGII